LVHQERQHHQPGQHYGEMLLAMPIMVLQVVALLFQRLAGLVCDLPPSAPASHERIHVALTHAEVGHPAPVLDLGRTPLPILDAIDAEVGGRGIERQGIDKAKAMDESYGAVVALIMAHPAGVFCGLALLAQRGLLPFFDTQKGGQTVGIQGLDRGRSRAQTVCSHDALEVGMILTPLSHKACGSITCTTILVRPIIVANRLRQERNDRPLVRMADGGASPLMCIGDGPITVHPVYTRGTVNCLRRQVPRAIEGQEGRPSKNRHGCQPLAALQVPKDACAHRTEHLGGDRIKDGAPMGIARDALNAREGVQIALGALLIKGQERIGSGNLGLVQAMLGQASEAASDQAKEGSGGEMRPYGRRHDGQEKPRYENTSVPVRGIFASKFTKGQCDEPDDHWPWRLSGNCWLKIR